MRQTVGSLRQFDDETPTIFVVHESPRSKTLGEHHYLCADTEWEWCGDFARVYLKKERDDWGRGRMSIGKKRLRQPIRVPT